MKTQHISTETEERVESGPLRINNDWTGYFLRGDDAFSVSMHMKDVANAIEKLREGTMTMEEFKNKTYLGTLLLYSLASEFDSVALE